MLIRDPQLRQVHWALASWTDGRDDPAGLAGLTLATLRASLLGTWATGSKDPAAERAALDALDEAWQARMAAPGDAAVNRTLLQRDRAAAALCDPRAFGRVLAALPAHRPEIVERDGVGVFALTTVEPVLPQVAKLVFERREQQALRGLARTWLPTVMARAEEHAARPERRVHAELLALTAPTSPTIALLEQPQLTAPRRAQALAAWSASQHPTRTVHLLYGGFDPAALQATLEAVFSSTSLPTPPAQPAQPAKPLTAQRRSVVPGAAPNSVSLAWVVPPGLKRWHVEIAARWLTTGRYAKLRQLLRKHYPDVELSSTAPWPNGGAPALLRIDARAPGGSDGLAGAVVKACRDAAVQDLKEGMYYEANSSAISDWHTVTADTREFAVRLAERALIDPAAKIATSSPRRVSGKDIRRALQAVFAGQPAIVEGK